MVDDLELQVDLLPALLDVVVHHHVAGTEGGELISLVVAARGGGRFFLRGQGRMEPIVATDGERLGSISSSAALSSSLLWGVIITAVTVMCVGLRRRPSATYNSFCIFLLLRFAWLGRGTREEIKQSRTPCSLFFSAYLPSPTP